jgi:O-antigen/teichoic acid export membrane protein
VFGARWGGATAIVPFLCAIGAPLYFQLMVTSALMAAGRSDRVLRWSLIEAGLTIALAPFGARYGLVGLAAVGSLRLYLMAPLGLRWLRHDTGLEPRLLLWPAARALAASTAMALAVWMAKPFLAAHLTGAAELAVLILVGALVYAALLPLTARALLDELTSRWKDFQLRRGPISESAA